LKYILLIAGGAIGTLLRYYLSELLIPNPLESKFPFGTFTVNLSGALLIGLLAGININSPMSSQIRLFLFTGVLGGFTTFSSFALESLSLLQNGKAALGIIYIFGTNIIGLLCAIIGYYSGLQLSK
jgi:fluoride exporter